MILDALMPGMDGFQLAKKIRGSGVQALQRIKASNKTSHLPVIVLTGSADPELPAKVRELGADDFLSKSVDFQKLEALLARLTGREPEQRKPSTPRG